MNRTRSIVTALALVAGGTLVPATAAAAHTPARCTPARPGNAFYAGGRIASVPVTTPKSACTTIAVSHIRDIARPGDNCQTFLVAFLSPDGQTTGYTEPVQACSPAPRQRTVLARDVPDGAVFRILYQVDYIEPEVQRVRYTVWR
jgi:hypothetical protein